MQPEDERKGIAKFILNILIIKAEAQTVNDYASLHCCTVGKINFLRFCFFALLLVNQAIFEHGV